MYIVVTRSASDFLDSIFKVNEDYTEVMPVYCVEGRNDIGQWKESNLSRQGFDEGAWKPRGVNIDVKTQEEVFLLALERDIIL